MGIIHLTNIQFTIYSYGNQDCGIGRGIDTEINGTEYRNQKQIHINMPTGFRQRWTYNSMEEMQTFKQMVLEKLGIHKQKFKRTASKHVYYLGWNRSPAQVGCMRQALGPCTLGKPRGSGWRGRWEWGSGWGTHVNPWLFHFNVWQNPLQIKKY